MTRALVVADAEFRALWKMANCVHDIATHYSVSAAVVRQCARRAGLPYRNDMAGVDEAALRRLWGEGVLVRDIAEELGRNPATICNLAAKLGLSSRKLEFKVADFDRTEVVALWFTTLKRLDLADALGVSAKRLRDLREAFDLPWRVGFPLKSEEELMQLNRVYEAQQDAGKAARPSRTSAVPRVGGAPFWTPERDARVFATGGKYRALVEAANALGKPLQHVQARWHRLEAAA